MKSVSLIAFSQRFGFVKCRLDRAACQSKPVLLAASFFN